MKASRLVWLLAWAYFPAVAGASSECRRLLAGDSSECRRLLAGDSPECRRLLAGDSQAHRVQSRSSAATPADRLEALKREFPAPLSGPVTEKSDPVTQRYYAKYRDRVLEMTLETLAADALWMREAAHDDILTLSMMDRNAHKTFDSQTRSFARKNAAWLKQRVVPYIAKLTQFQRGR